MRLRPVPVGIFLVVAVIAGIMVVSGQHEVLASRPDKPWPAPVTTKEAELSVPLAPKDALATFTMPPGYRVELVASEPLVKDPILFEFDGDGRLWVMEMPGFSINDQMENSFEPINDLVILEDTDNDGVFDKRTVFMDKLIMPRAFKILDRNCALVGAPPNLWKACDTNGDLKSDTRELIANTFSNQGVVEHGANGLYWGMDNTIYVSEHTWDVEYADGKFRTRPSLRRGQWGITQDNGGRIYRDVNTDPLFVDYVAPKYFMRNLNLVRTDGLYESLVKQEDTLIWPIHPTLGVNRGYRTDIFREDKTSTYYGGVSSPLVYRGQSLPEAVQNQPFVVDGPTNIVHLLKLTNDNGKLAASDYYKKGEFLASTDTRFRPVALTGGWDGTIYVADMYRGISQDGPIQTDYLRDYNAKRGLAKGLHYGRIYRVVYKGMKVDQKPSMSKDTPAQLVAHLSHTNGWWRDTAQQLLVQRNDRSAVPALEQLAATAADPRPRLHALWTLDGMNALRPELVVTALKDESADVRAAALRLSEHWLESNVALQTAVVQLLNDPDWFVRRQLAATLGELPRAARLAPIMQALKLYGADSITVDAALSGLSGQESDALALLMKQPAPDVVASVDAIDMLAGAISKGRDVAKVQTLLAMASDAGQSTAVRIAVMDGLAQGLKASGGGNGGGGGEAVAGGRAGAAVPGVARRRAVSTFAVATAPRSLLAISNGKDPLSAAARTTIELLDWPGKPEPPAVAPLSPEDEKRFAAGKVTYQTVCAACHTADGSGVAHVGAKLAGSKWANAPAETAIRILVNGKEGSVGLMPPLGTALSDDAVASVLTFVRRSFGNASPPVVPAEVKETREAYSHRTTPWTEAELALRRR
jgi:mono/diheme cytochrome c family protein